MATKTENFFQHEIRIVENAFGIDMIAEDREDFCRNLNDILDNTTSNRVVCPKYYHEYKILAIMLTYMNKCLADPQIAHEDIDLESMVQNFISAGNAIFHGRSDVMEKIGNNGDLRVVIDMIIKNKLPHFCIATALYTVIRDVVGYKRHLQIVP